MIPVHPADGKARAISHRWQVSDSLYLRGECWDFVRTDEADASCLWFSRETPEDTRCMTALDIASMVDTEGAEIWRGDSCLASATLKGGRSPRSEQAERDARLIERFAPKSGGWASFLSDMRAGLLSDFELSEAAAELTFQRLEGVPA